MSETHILYAHNSFVITIALFVAMLIANEFGFRVGRFVQISTDDDVKALTGAVQASVLGILALLLGFTFSMSMQRYDNRSYALIDETNAIGTALLRAELLPESYRQDAARLLREYVDLRITVAQIELTRRDERTAYNRRVTDTQNALWAIAVAAANVDPRPVTTGAFVTALNELIDAQGRRNALLQMHVPEVVLLLLFLVFISSGGILGYSSGLSGKRIVIPTALVSLLIAMVVFIIIDLDRPKRGLIQVDQRPMLELRQDDVH